MIVNTYDSLMAGVVHWNVRPLRKREDDGGFAVGVGNANIFPAAFVQVQLYLPFLRYVVRQKKSVRKHRLQQPAVRRLVGVPVIFAPATKEAPLPRVLR